MRSIYDNVQVGGVTGPIFCSVAAIVTTGAIFDTEGYNTAALRVYATPLTGSSQSAVQLDSVVAVLQECATVGGTYTTAKDNTGTAIGFTLVATTVGVIGSARIEGLGLNRQRFLKVQLSPSVTTVAGGSGFTTFAILEAGRAFTLPVPEGIPVSNT